MQLTVESSFIKIKHLSICNKWNGSCVDDIDHIGKCIFGLKKGMKLIDCNLLESNFESNICTNDVSGGGKTMKRGKEEVF